MGGGPSTPSTRPLGAGTLQVAGLFSGIGGLELGLERAGHDVISLCESWAPAQAVLRERFPRLPLSTDVRHLRELPGAHLVAAGFPCNDLSQAGRTAGIGGEHSGLVSDLLRLVRSEEPPLVLLENVPNMLALHKGAAMRLIVGELEAAGYRWAYRTVDSRFTGVPQRRRRVLLLASRCEIRPENVLLADDTGQPRLATEAAAYGFYWTEGRGGLGWVPDALPTLKGGSTIGIPSAPAAWLSGQDRGLRLVMPSLEDGESLQGLPKGWTSPAENVGQRNHRWKLIGNAVTVGVSNWVGRRLLEPSEYDGNCDVPFNRSDRWPAAAWSRDGVAVTSHASAWPEQMPYRHLVDLIDVEAGSPLSYRAASGFLGRLDESRLKVDDTFLRDVEDHVRCLRPGLSRRPRQLMGNNNGPPPVMPDPEDALRRLLYSMGLRYRLHTRPEAHIRQRVTLVFRSTKVAVDIRACDDHGCPYHASATTTGDRKASRRQRLIQRNAELEANLADAGWTLVVVWHHDDLVEAAREIVGLVTEQRRREAA